MARKGGTFLSILTFMVLKKARWLHRAFDYKSWFPIRIGTYLSVETAKGDCNERER